MTIPDDYQEVHLLVGDWLTMIFEPGETVHRLDLTANRQIALKPGDTLTVRGQVTGTDCCLKRAGDHSDGSDG